MHNAAYRWVGQQVRLAGPFSRVVEIGSKNINGSVRPLFGADDYIGIDVVKGPGVDRVADGATYRPKDQPDCCVCCEVLEHAANAAAIVANMRAMLAPGGLLVITCASGSRSAHSAVDGGPLRPGEYYANVSPDDLRAWLEGLDDLEIATSHELGDVYAVARKP